MLGKKTITDNGYVIQSKLKPNCKAFFATSLFNGKKIYIAANRAARRYLESNNFQKFAKREGLDLDLKTYSVS